MYNKSIEKRKENPTNQEGKNMVELRKALQIINGSKEYKFEGTILTVKNYYTGQAIELDLGKLTEEILEELQPEPEEEDDEWSYYDL